MKKNGWMNKKTVILGVALLLLLCIGSYLLGHANGKNVNKNAGDSGGKAGIQTAQTGQFVVNEQYLESIVMLEVYDANGNRIATGSGFVAFDDKRLVTCRHVLVNMEYAVCTTDSGKTFRVDTICAADEENDIALCKLPDGCELAPLPLAEVKPVRGESVLTVSSQFGLTNLVTAGNVSTVKDSFFLFTSPVSSGSSGGPLINDLGQVIGIIRGTYNDGQNMNTATPIKIVVELGEGKL